MTTPAPATPVSRRPSGIESCPSCGQPLRDQRAVRHLRKSELEFERILEAAVRARIAELAGERLQSHADVDEARLDSAEARHTEDLDKLRTLFRQF